MPFPKEKHYTSEDYWNLPEGTRAELINGTLYNMAPPSRIHQKLVSEFTQVLGQYIKSHHGNCEVYPAPFAVNLDADDKDWVEPDISVICDPSKFTDRGCSGAPDLIMEIVSPASRRMDYIKKTALYLDSGVREYWVVDPTKKYTTVYSFEQGKDVTPVIFPFDTDIPVGIYPGLTICVNDLL